jgi:hypothetical protein
MSPRQRLELVGHRGLEILLASVDAVCAAYFLLTPTASFRMTPTWASLLAITGDMHWLGWMFAIVTFGAVIGIAGVPWTARLSFLTALVPWGAVATSFVVAAWTLAGLGTMTAALVVLAAILHVATVGHFAPGRRP